MENMIKKLVAEIKTMLAVEAVKGDARQAELLAGRLHRYMVNRGVPGNVMDEIIKLALTK